MFWNTRDKVLSPTFSVEAGSEELPTQSKLEIGLSSPMDKNWSKRKIVILGSHSIGHRQWGICMLECQQNLKSICTCTHASAPLCVKVCVCECVGRRGSTCGCLCIGCACRCAFGMCNTYWLTKELALWVSGTKGWAGINDLVYGPSNHWTGDTEGKTVTREKINSIFHFFH